MSYTNKPFEKLDVMDDFLMNAVTSDPEVGIPFCRKVVSVLLQQEIGKVQVVSQRTLTALLPDRRGIRMDVEIEEYVERDGLKFIYFYPNGAHGGNEEIRAMLQYLQHSTVDNAIDEATREVHGYVTKVKVLPEVRQGYMRYEEHIYYAKRDGAIEVLVEDILELLGEHGAISEELKEKLVDTRDVALLKRYRKTATKVDSIEAFMKQIEA